jgi:hypothetical protein
MKEIACLLASLLLVGCGSAIAPNQPDGKDCNFSVPETACVAASFCDPGLASADGTYARTHKYGDKSHVVGTCRPKGAVGAACLGNGQCASGKCGHAGTPAIGSKGACE